MDDEEDEDCGLLWHYTSAVGVMGILKERELWASDCVLLNDANEVREGFEVASALCADALKAFVGERDIGVAEFEKFATKFVAGNWASDTSIFVASLSGSGNSLSQWRGYCPPAGGYAVGFVPEAVAEIARAQRFKFEKCVYQRELQRSALQSVLTPLDIFEKAISEGRTAQVWRHIRTEMMDRNFRRRLLAVVAFIKNKGFVEERESRLVFAHHVDQKSLSFRPSKGSGGALIPFMKFGWGKTAQRQFPNPIGAIRIGPMAQQEAAESRLHAYLASIGYEGDEIPKVTRSRIPFRV